MIEHLVARCGVYRMLFPSENVGDIRPLPEFVHLSPVKIRRTVPVVLDLRVYLGVPARDCGVRMGWHSTDGARRVDLVLDEVEAIVHCGPGDRRPTPMLPPRLRLLCDGAMPDSQGRFRLCIRPDTALPVSSPRDRRDVLAALRFEEMP